ncbi:hypothetical protein [Hyphomonas sp.]|uniref:hypothetical protein n=1 Tax=Hyphomonas sp. TaxID=87 RepID=UPI003529A62A
MRAADWHRRTGRNALINVDHFGNIRFLCLGDVPPPDTLYRYEAPRVPRWQRPAYCSDVPAALRVQSIMVRHDPAWSGLIMHRHDIVRYDPALHVHGPP